MSRWMTLGLLFAALAVLGSFCVVVIDEREQGFRTLLGRPDPLGAVLTKPNWYLRVPMLHAIDIYERRVQRYDAPPQEAQLADGQLIDVDYFVAYRINDPQLFREQIRTESRLHSFLDDQSFGPLRDVLARNSLETLLSERRADVMQEIKERVAERLIGQGVEITDVRLRRTDYPEANLPQTFERMIKERERFARRYRAEGEEEARKIRSLADLEARVVRADARRRGAELRGEGESEATRIYAEAYDKDPEFYGFLRSLEAYRLALDQQTTVILSPKIPFLRHLFENSAESPDR